MRALIKFLPCDIYDYECFWLILPYVKYKYIDMNKLWVPFFARSYEEPRHVIYMITILKVYELIMSPSFCEALSDQAKIHMSHVESNIFANIF